MAKAPRCKWLIGVEAGRLLGDQRIEERRLKSITSCDNAFVTNIVLARDPGALVKRLIGRPQEALLCAKAKRQQQSAQPERKSISRFAKELYFFIAE